MSTIKGFATGTVPQPAGTTALDTRKANAFRVVSDAAGVPRTGVLGTNPSIVTTDASTAPMRVAVAKAGFVTSRSVGDGVIDWGNDGSIFVTVTKPLSNRHIVVIYAKHNDAGAGDPTSLPVIEAVAGAASATPAKPAIPSGAEELATLDIPSTATSTQSAGVVLTNTYKMTAAAGGTVWVRNVTERNAWTPAGGSTAYQIDTDAHYYRRGGGWVAANSDGISFAGPPLFGAAWDGVSPLIVKKGSATASTVASGDASIIFASAFPNGMLHADVRRRDFTSYGATSEILHVTQALDRVNFRVYTAGGTALASAPTIPFVFEAIGW